MQVALYRKYRPQNFKEVVGQEHIVSVLENEAKTGKVSHAYLFSGSRGTGKTTIARIFARAIGVHDEDIYEIDAASNRGIDDIRGIREAVHVMPYSSKYKVYIVDEVHMLTRDAWNAFLKTLEEPPPHVIFIMATTEAHKLPDTVVSRCETFTFTRPSHSTLVATILHIAKEEGVELERSSAGLIATLAEGSFRDALSILQKAIHSSADTTLSPSEIEKILGAPKSSYVLNILDAIGKGEYQAGVAAVHQISKAGADMNVALTMLLRMLRFVLLLRFAKDLHADIESELSEEEFSRLSELAVSAKNLNSKSLLAFLNASSLQSHTSIPELPLELALIEICGVEKTT